jgi:hypothetical protein
MSRPKFENLQVIEGGHPSGPGFETMKEHSIIVFCLRLP